jgi:hypothetical protein
MQESTQIDNFARHMLGLHGRYRGKIQMQAKMPVADFADLAVDEQ